MDARTRLGLAVLGAALLLGALGDALLRATPWGINFVIWVGAVICAVAAGAWIGGLRFVGEGRWLIPVALLFAAAVAWRDSVALAFLNVLACGVAVALAMLRGRSGTLRLSGISEYVFGGFSAAALSVAGPLPVAIGEVKWRQVARGRWRPQALAVTRGVLLAAPLLLLFGTLFVAADAIFEEMVLDIFGFDVAEVFGHLTLALAIAWIAAGSLWVALLARAPANLGLHRPDAVSLGIVEVGVVLGLLDLLFLAFVAVQVRYLFGGAESIVTTSGLTYAEYARRGFFELVVVTAIALPTLLLAHWLLGAVDRRGERIFKALAAILIASLFVVMASALQRMYLYVETYGLTTLRLYVTIFMIWLAVLFVWFIVTVLAGRRDRFAFGAMLAAFVTVLAVNVLNPDALVARTNLARMQEGEWFDVHYLTGLSADAVPVLVGALPSLNDADRRIVEEALHESRRWSPENTDWRTWNLGRSHANYLISTATRPRDPEPAS